MSAINRRDSIQLQEIDVDLVISSKIYLKKTAKISYLKELASKEFKHLGHGSEFDYYVMGHQIQGDDNNSIESLACYNSNKIVLKPSANYKNQYEEIRKTLEDDGNKLYLY